MRFLIQVAAVLLLTAGCRTAQPELKPAKEQEVLRTPPAESRYDVGGLPKQAFNTDDPTKKNSINFGNNMGGPASRGSMNGVSSASAGGSSPGLR